MNDMKVSIEIFEYYGNSHQSILLWNVSVSTLVHWDILLFFSQIFNFYFFYIFENLKAQNSLLNVHLLPW